MQNNPDLVIELSSHTDFIGSDESNMLLSQQRAESVVNYLVSKGINGSLLKAQGYV
jgi:outer membrane protein OmpA-like peptidoglycan-associated protein